MRLTATLFALTFVCNFGFTQHHAKTVSQQSEEWLETSTNASDAIHFSVEVFSNEVELFWEVNKESAVAGYELQRASNGENFHSIAWFNAIGEAEIGGSYLHLDDAPPLQETIQYRIKVIRKDGRYIYSSTQIIDLHLSRPIIDLSASDDIQPRFIAIDDTKLDTSKQIELLDTSGKTVLRLSPNGGKLSMDLSRLKQGVYFIKMALLDGEDKIERIVKQG